MKTKSVLRIGFLILALTTVIVSCRKNDKEPDEADSDTTAVQDQSLASTIVDDISNITDEAGRSGSVSGYRMADIGELIATSCATVTIDSIAASSKTITVNFGTSNCLCNDFKFRRGSLIINFTGRYRDSSTVITIIPKNYFVNDNLISGTKTIKNLGDNSAGHLVYQVTANLLIFKANNGGTIIWQSNRQREWIAGENTLTYLDDKYSVTGSANGTNTSGKTFSSIITSPLIKDMTCGQGKKHFISGKIEHAPSGKAIRYIDFGNGVCDDIATVTINGKTYTINLN